MAIEESVVSAEVDNTLQDLHNSSDDMKAKFKNIVLLFIQNINRKVIIMAGQSWLKVTSQFWQIVNIFSLPAFLWNS